MRTLRLIKRSLAAMLVLVLFSPGLAPSIELDGFIESAFGARTQDDTTRHDLFNLFETRLQLKGSYEPGAFADLSPEINYKGELLADGYEEHLLLLIREANIAFTPTDTMDVKLGRQTLTWGTGDLLFINDLFPKDYISFFTGRDDEYLKRPSDAVKLSLFSEAANFDVVISPVMEANNSITGSRFSFYDGLSGASTGEAASRKFVEPDKTFENIEVALRIYRTFGSFEGALYYFHGFYNEPRGILNAASEEFFYPRLTVYGTSLRGPVLGGIGNIEIGYYDSREDPKGEKGNIENPALKFLTGFTKDLGGDLSIGAQYLIEEMLKYSAYEASLGAGEIERDEFRHLLTLRITKLLRDQTVIAGLFIFYSPTDEDAYLRPSVSYNVTDSLKLRSGANIFLGVERHTEFGQFQRNDNLYLRARYSF